MIVMVCFVEGAEELLAARADLQELYSQVGRWGGTYLSNGATFN